uniref:Potassium channel tetramerisation-type BTB domain-containing protein n=1 Tax=Gopherus agassizii TaxID=38772 RepID=A0A452GNI4_9SAUR
PSPAAWPEEGRGQVPADGGDPPGLPVGPVTLNVGGTFYSTTLETLTRFPDSMLGAMFRGPRPARTDRRGHYFIDRDGKAFRHVLNFLRLGRLDLPEGYSELALGWISGREWLGEGGGNSSSPISWCQEWDTCTSIVCLWGGIVARSPATP